MNQLARSSSPYLRQHAENPVDWREWSSEAFAEARERDVPVLLSIGYSACHWCHVMAHESFENVETAAVMNAGFVCIKVDREERPDLDSVYMEATVAMTGHGGWPMTCLLTPDAQPFHCGTYYPPTARQGLPGFTQLLDAASTAWRERRDDVRAAGAAVVAQLEASAGALGVGVVDAGVLDTALEGALSQQDTVHGGFGGAPKFPPSLLAEALLRHHERTGSTDALAAVHHTCAAMARGGLHDQLAGGFARYSVDAAWVVPHFEKMLYDNALLLRAYAHLARRTGDALAHRVASSTAEFLLRDLRTDAGALASALDADSDGEEGLTYAWTPAELVQVLGQDDGAWAAELLVVTVGGTFERGSSVLQLPADPTDVPRWERVRTVLLAARTLRPQPARDDKVVTAWNGLAITALAEAGAALGEPGWVRAASEVAEHVVAVHLVDGRLRRSSLGGAVGAAAGVLEDHGSLAQGLLALHQATGEQGWLEQACALLDVTLAHFRDPAEPGAWFDTADDAEVLVRRPRDPLDNVTPCGASAITEALQTAAALADLERSSAYGLAATEGLARAGAVLARAPRSGGHWWSVAEAALTGPLQVAVTDGPGSAGLLSAARTGAPGGAVVVGGARDSTPLLADRYPVDGAAAAYVCRGFVCDRPVTGVDELRALL